MKEDEENDIEDPYSLIFDNPMENPEEQIISFFQMWGWDQAKIKLWNMYKRSCSHPDYETFEEKDDLVLYLESMANMMKGSYILHKKWQESRTK